MTKQELINQMNEGYEVTLQGSFADGETNWHYEYWKLDSDMYQCSYDGECSHYFNLNDLEFSFNPNDADIIEIRR